MLSLFLIAAAQTTDFGVRVQGQVPPARKVAAPRSSFVCQVRTVTDGDTLRCSDGIRVRLAGIDAPEISACAANRKCVAGDGLASKRSLSRIAAGRTLRCEPVGTSYKRVVAFCSTGGMDLSCAQVRAAQAVPRYSEQKRICR